MNSRPTILPRANVRYLPRITPMPAPFVQRNCACGGTPGPSRECEACRTKRMSLQRGNIHPSFFVPHSSAAPPIVQEVLDSPGQPLDMGTRAFMEPPFDHDFSHVRLHTDAHSAASARTLNAVAYTVAHHIAFDMGSYAPQTKTGSSLLAHELAHTLQQSTARSSSFRLFNSPEHEQEADTAAEAVCSRGSIPTFQLLPPGAVSRQRLQPDELLKIDRPFELDPRQFLKPMDAPAEREVEKCEEFPGGETNCQVNEKTGIPTGKVTHHVDEKNPCTRPCVERHEAVHVKQMEKFCPELRDCYLAADKGKGSALDCAKMAIFGMKERECEAYKVSVPCVEERIKNAKECHTKDNKDYGARKLASEKCFRNKYCGS
jgi:hypothetical protein